MTEQLDRVHALLAAGNVPCEMKRRAGGGPVLVAGTPTSAQWDVLIWESAGQLMVQHKGTIDRLPADGTDQAVADTVKFRVVQSWADQGDPQARALLSAIGGRYGDARPSATPREATSYGDAGPAARSRESADPAMRSVTAHISPWGFGLRVTETEAGQSIPTSWAWQWGLGPSAVADYYQRFFSTVRRSAMLGEGGNE
jgi:hypothetical protein